MDFRAMGEVASHYGNYILKLEAQDRIGTAGCYLSSLTSLLDYLPQLRFADITELELHRYEQWMKKKDNSITTTSLYLRCLRRIFNIAIAKKLIDRDLYPFGQEKYIIPIGRNIKKAVPIDTGELCAANRHYFFVKQEALSMRGLVKYSELAALSLREVVAVICDEERIRYGDLTLTDLLLEGTTSQIKVSDYQHPVHYGMGAYIFFDGDDPVYIGKAINFLLRLSSHRNIEIRPYWGWNVLLQRVCARRLNSYGEPAGEQMTAALAIVEEFGIVRVLLDRPDAREKLSRVERVIMKGVKHQSATLLNTRIGRVQDDFLSQTLEDLLR